MMRGALIVFEGCDCVGKTTQITKLYEKLTSLNKKVHLLKFPDRTTFIGKILNDYLSKKQVLNDHVVHLLFSANRWECVNTMKQLIYSGTTILLDRYVYSGIAYSAAKGNIDLNWCKETDKGLPKPDLVVYLEWSDEKKLFSRKGFGNEIYENKVFQINVKKFFNELKDDNWKVFDCELGIDQIHQNILKEVDEILENKLNNDLLNL